MSKNGKTDSGKPDSGRFDFGKWIRSLFVITDHREPRLLTFFKKPGARSVVTSLVSIFAGLIVGFIFMIIIALTNENITIGKNACVFGETEYADYQNNTLASGKTLIKAGDSV